MAICETPEERQRAVKLATCVVGIVASLLVYGVLQERIMTQVRVPVPQSDHCTQQR
jgi:hypothetical protein